MPPILSTLRSSEGRLAFLERKRKAELKRMGTKEVPILVWTKVPQQGADEEDTYVPISIAPGAEANNISRKDLCSAKIQKFQGSSPELYCPWRMDMQELFTARDCDDILDLEHVEQQLKLYKTTLMGPTMDAFTTALKHTRMQSTKPGKIARRTNCPRPW
jgi:hypothetical protein